MMEVHYQRRDQIDARHIVNIIDLNVGSDSLVSARLDARFENVSVVEVLHRLRAQIHT